MKEGIKSQQQEKLTLWIASASNGKPFEQPQPGGPLIYTEITQLYARNEEHAKELIQPWLAQRPHLPIHSLKEYPSGFRAGMFTCFPGSLLLS